VSTESQILPKSSILPAELSFLFPAGVIVKERRTPGDASELLPSEAFHMAKARHKRVHEFAAGRACAKSALAEFGMTGVALLPAADRQPIWPDGFIGSITHTDGYCAAAVAALTVIRGVGLDSEIVGAPTPDIWSTVCRADELGWVNSLPARDRPAAVTLLFSAKEAFYKCQYPVVGEWLDFHDLTIRCPTWGDSRGAFDVRPTRTLAIARHVTLPISGRYMFHERYVSAGISIPAGATPQ